jgi:hypothetical protein
VFRRKASRQVVSWLALLAMALIVMMPVISRVMPMTGSMQGMGGACPHRMGGKKHPAPNHLADPTDRCGYCVLLDHQSILAASHVSYLLPAAPIVAESTPIRVRRMDATPRLSADPRGPPRIG